MGGHVSWRVEGRARPVCYVYDDRPPILDASDGSGFSLTISPGGKDVVSPGHVAFAREFAEQAGRYARECARWVVQSTPESGPGSGGVPLSVA